MSAFFLLHFYTLFPFEHFQTRAAFAPVKAAHAAFHANKFAGIISRSHGQDLLKISWLNFRCGPRSTQYIASEQTKNKVQRGNNRVKCQKAFSMCVISIGPATPAQCTAITSNRASDSACPLPAR